MNAPTEPRPTDPPRRPFPTGKLLVLLATVALIAIGLTQFSEHLRLESLAAHEASLRQYQTEYPWAVYGAAFLTYVAVTALSLPAAGGMSLLFAWFFGFWRALLLISFASTAGATLAFLLSRYLFRDLIQQRFGDRLTSFDDALRKEGAFYLFTLRLIPAVPFFVINLVMGLTPMRAATFWWVSQVGMLPGTAVYVYTGDAIPTLQELAQEGASGILSWQILLAFAMLGFFPIVAKRLLERLRPRRVDNSASDAPYSTS